MILWRFRHRKSHSHQAETLSIIIIRCTFCYKAKTIQYLFRGESDNRSNAALWYFILLSVRYVDAAHFITRCMIVYLVSGTCSRLSRVESGQVEYQPAPTRSLTHSIIHRGPVQAYCILYIYSHCCVNCFGFCLFFLPARGRQTAPSVHTHHDGCMTVEQAE